MRNLGRKTSRRKVAADARRQRERREPTDSWEQRYEEAADEATELERQRKAANRTRFQHKYNNTKPNPWPARVQLDRHVFLPKTQHLTGNGKRGRVPLRALAVYPVLASRANYQRNDWRPISQQNIAELAGMSDVTAARAVADLCHATMGRRSMALLDARLETRRARYYERSYYFYRTRFIRPHMRRAWRGECFVFHVALIDSRVWRALRDASKVLYLGLRSVARFDAQLYAQEEGVDLVAGVPGSKADATEFYRVFGQRKWDVYRGSLARVCRLLGLSDKSPGWMVRELQRAGLVEPLEAGYKVHLRPPRRLIPADPANAPDPVFRDDRPARPPPGATGSDPGGVIVPNKINTLMPHKIDTLTENAPQTCVIRKRSLPGSGCKSWGQGSPRGRGDQYVMILMNQEGPGRAVASGGGVSFEPPGARSAAAPRAQPAG